MQHVNELGETFTDKYLVDGERGSSFVGLSEILNENEILWNVYEISWNVNEMSKNVYKMIL